MIDYNLFKIKPTPHKRNPLRAKNLAKKFWSLIFKEKIDDPDIKYRDILSALKRMTASLEKALDTKPPK